MIVALAITAAYHWAPVKPALMSDLGLLKDLKDFVQVLFPFFVGALAAVATFSRAGLDCETVGTPVTLDGKALTRRQFVCYIFGYCAVLSVFLFIAVIVTKLLQPSAMLFCPAIISYLRSASVAFFSLCFTHLVVISLWGLYYLSNRLVRMPVTTSLAPSTESKPAATEGKN